MLKENKYIISGLIVSGVIAFASLSFDFSISISMFFITTLLIYTYFADHETKELRHKSDELFLDLKDKTTLASALDEEYKKLKVDYEQEIGELKTIVNFQEVNPEPVFKVDYEGLIVSSNNAANKVLPFITNNDGYLKVVWKKYLEIALQCKHPIRDEFPIDESIYSIYLAPSVNENTVSFFATDITELKESQELLIAASMEANKANKAKTEFLSNMSHEIRTPLNGILGMNDLLLDSKLSSTQLIYSEAIKESGDNLLIIINDILDLSKIEDGKLDIEHYSFNLEESIKNIQLLLSTKLNQQGLNFIYKIDPKIPRNIKTDGTRLRQILINIINNAIKFTEEGGIIIEIKIIEKIEHQFILEFSINDSGIGIPEDKLTTIFSSFTQTDASISRKYGGTGLGLTISKKLCQLLGGDMRVKSTLGKGTTFYFTIMSEPSDIEVNKGKVVSLEDIDLPPMEILVAEDNLINQTLILFLLDRLGYKAEVANNGLEVIECMKLKSYDVIFMDIQMPQMDGVTATKELYKIIDEEDFPYIIALTASAFQSDKDRCLDAGMHDYISKPIQREKLIETLFKAVDKSKRNKKIN